MAASAVSRLDISTESTTEIDARVVEHGRWGRYLSGDLVPLKLLPSASITSLLIRRAFLVLHSSVLSGVTHLRLGPFPSYHRLRWSSLLVCDDVQVEYGSFDVCDLPSLTHLRFVSTHWSADYIFAALRMPRLRVLSFDGCLPSIGCTGSGSTRYASVECLVLDCPVPSDLDFVQVLLPFINLRSLDLRGMPPSSVSGFLAIRRVVSADGLLAVERLCPSLSSVHVGVRLTEGEATAVLEDIHPRVFSPGCTLNHVVPASHCAGSVLPNEGAFRYVGGRVVPSAYLSAVDTHEMFSDTFCG
ncbi:hypothetical protein R3P38DRAFT_2765964 [Favolaschia claudopus]|uniref:Uncharacterized protein n=1 Tax=Favolaschia claudopus TaxID=2862362 RepID=A0AAW0D0B2_9AGAR